MPNCAGVTFGAREPRDIPPRKCSLKPTVFRRNVNATSGGDGDGYGDGDGDGRFIRSRKDVSPDDGSIA